MSEAAERPSEERASRPDADAWATACEEDLAAEKARRRAQYGAPPTNAADELRRLADAVSERLSGLGGPLGNAAASAAAQGVAQQLIAQAKAAIEPVVERNPQLFGHLAAAGNELLAAYHSAVHEAEHRWTAEPGSGSGTGTEAGAGERGTARGGPERIDLDKEPEPGESGEPGKGRGSTPDDGGPDDPWGAGGVDRPGHS
ncbi:DUF5304 domain-containing protein [Streptomyces daliensis]|uniref:DUF5304 domain-containing protein n=1 Tax=Streptomyces daliensis TaxID=299421 RepID=A0A8T4J5F2_9ACTN|nr:DUF5304 domain-containing protein [Streptomyces daliensis]